MRRERGWPPGARETVAHAGRIAPDHPRLRRALPSLARYLPDPGCAIRRCISAFTRSGISRLPLPWSLVDNDPATTRSLPAMSASKPYRATSAGSSLSEAPTFVSSMSARSKNTVSVGPGIREVTVTPVSLSSCRSASANDCTNDFDAL